MKVKAIVLKGQNTKEKDKNILLFSLEEGKFWATLKGVRGEKAKMKYAKEPFCFGDFVIEEGKNSKIVTSVDIIEPFDSLSQDIDKYFEGNALLEIINSLNFDESAPIFINLIKALKILTFHNVSKYACLLKFLIDIFDNYGVSLYSPKCTSCGGPFHDHIYINYLVGELCCTSCRPFQSEEIGKGEYNILKLFSTNDYEKLPTIKFSNELGLNLLKILVTNFSYRFEKQLKLIGILN